MKLNIGIGIDKNKKKNNNGDSNWNWKKEIIYWNKANNINPIPHNDNINIKRLLVDHIVGKRWIEGFMTLIPITAIEWIVTKIKVIQIKLLITIDE